MFQVQRFTDEQQDDDLGNDSTSILNRMLARAKARSSAKRARLGPDISDGVHQQTAAGVIPQAGGCSSKASEVEDDTATMRTSGGESLANGSTMDHRATAEDASEGTHDSSSSEEESSSSESGSERGEKDGDGSELGADEEEPGEAAAIAGGRVGGERGVEAGGQQGLRPMEEVAEEWGLDSRLTEILRREGVKHFFPIQVRVVPDIVATERHSHVQSRDICVSAPTGSGKTLVFVLGVLQALIRRRVVRLRALVLLPSRDLAMQVHSVFMKYARGTGLRVGLAIGQTNFLEEQLALVGPVALAGNPTATARASFLRAQGRAIGPTPMMEGSNLDSGGWSGAGAPAGGSSEVDIVVATPGRLLDHLAQTPGFTLQHLRYLIIDEADRLLNQSYQGWVGKVIKAAYRKELGTAAPVYERFTFNDDGKHDDVTAGVGAEPGGSRRQPQLLDVDKAREGDNNGSNSVSSQLQQGVTGVGKRRRPPSRRPPSAFSLDPVTVRGRPLATGERIRGATVSTPPLRKLLFSATLTNNPQKLAGLDVVNPLIYTATEVSTAAGGTGRATSGADGDKRPSQETRRSNLDERGTAVEGGGRFSTPATLEETYTVCDSQAKPLVLLSLLREMVGRQADLSVVFTSSVDSTHRLFRLLQLFGGFERTAGTDAEGGGGGGDTCLADDAVHGDGNDDGDGGVAEFSSSLGQRQRSSIIRAARAGAVRVIVCSDGMARGMDLDGVGLVVNYDVPSQAKTYVHRVGRTARAGSRGTAVTITKKGQVKQFLKMRSGIDKKRVRLDSSPADQSRLLPLAGRYQLCLKDLKEVLEAERTGELDPSAPVTATESNA
ncbi:unnamed protein product [Ectocarpus sp. CCAP 1310/34]|nr:unnamed protein product [Ectocarpus sp. CCAP 1310/34]